MREIYRILDANYNRAREALRVAEDCGRFALNDPAITAMAKNLRSELTQTLGAMPHREMLASRDTPGDIGTEISSPSEPLRKDLADVATAACKRLTEALRTIEEYSKIIAPDQTLAVERMRYNSYTLEQRLIGRLETKRRFGDVRLYVLITSGLYRGSARDVARAVVAGGTEAIQLREKHGPDRYVLATAAEMRELTDETNRLFIVNDRPDIAAIVGADGVHLGQTDIPVADARRLLRPGAVVGKSCHTPAQVRTAVNEGADYIAVGPMFPTETKDAGPIAGPELLREAREITSLPIVPIGGITLENLDELLAAGAERVAVCHAVCMAENPKRAAEELLEKISQAKR